MGISLVCMDERWLPVVGFEGYYEVSDRGQIRSVPRIMVRSNGYPFTVRSTIRRPSKSTKYGHQTVDLYRGGGRDTCETVSVHVTVLTAFKGPCPLGQECCHNDGDATNNHLGNLRWDTREANVHDALEHGTMGTWDYCSKGHALTSDNLYVYGERRHCRECAKERSLASYYRRKGR